MAIKNVWSLQVGEAIVGDIIKHHLGKDYELFFPLNSQLKDFDFVLMNKNTKKFSTIQVKESREFNSEKGDGFFIISKSKVQSKVADFYIFLVHTTVATEHKFKIVPRTLIVPAQILWEKSKDKKLIKEKDYYYYFKIQGNKAFDDREGKDKIIYYNDYVDNFDLLKI